MQFAIRLLRVFVLALSAAGVGGTQASTALTDDETQVLPKGIDGGSTSNMMQRHLLRLMDEAWGLWKKNYEARTSPAQITEYQAELRGQLRKDECGACEPPAGTGRWCMGRCAEPF